MEARKVKKSKAAYILLLLLTVGIIAYIILLAMRNFVTSLTTLKTQEITEIYTVSLDGYLFRDEQVLTADSVCVAEYAIGDGEKIGVNDKIADEYSVAAGCTEAEARNAQSRLNALNRRIEIIKSGADGGGVSEALEIKELLRDNYVGMMQALSDGRLNDVSDYSDGFLSGLTGYKIVTGQSSDGGESDVSALKAEIDGIVASLGGITNSLTCEKSGYFYCSADGYENLFDSKKLSEIGLADLLALTSDSSPEEYSGYVIGKMVYGAEWYLAAPADAETCKKLKAGAEYAAVFEGENSMILNLTVESVMLPENGESRGAVIFRSDEMPSGFSFGRVQRITLTVGSVSGYRVPNNAIYTVDGVEGVYILENSVVYFRRIYVIADCGSYSIVGTVEDTAENQVQCLRLNDLIITGGTNLYEGKIYY